MASQLSSRSSDPDPYAVLDIPALEVGAVTGIGQDDAGAPFEALDEHDPQYAIPASLTLIADKLLTYARGQSAPNLSPEEITLLKAHYLHQSAHWNVYPGESGATTAHFVNRPAKDNKRANHANKSEGVFLP